MDRINLDRLFSSDKRWRYISFDIIDKGTIISEINHCVLINNGGGSDPSKPRLLKEYQNSENLRWKRKFDKVALSNS
jgi:hypothetical protein